MKRLIEAAGERGRDRLSDRTLLLMLFRHGLRAGEACLSRWDAVMFDARTISITRLKKSESGIHRLQEDEIEALWQLQSQGQSHYVFANELWHALARWQTFPSQCIRICCAMPAVTIWQNKACPQGHSSLPGA